MPGLAVCIVAVVAHQNAPVLVVALVLVMPRAIRAVVLTLAERLARGGIFRRWEGLKVSMPAVDQVKPSHQRRAAPAWDHWTRRRGRPRGAWVVTAAVALNAGFVGREHAEPQRNAREAIAAALRHELLGELVGKQLAVAEDVSWDRRGRGRGEGCKCEAPEQYHPHPHYTVRKAYGNFLRDEASKARRSVP